MPCTRVSIRCPWYTDMHDYRREPGLCARLACSFDVKWTRLRPIHARLPDLGLCFLRPGKYLLENLPQPSQNLVAVLRNLIVSHEAASHDLEASLFAELHETIFATACSLQIEPAHVRVRRMNKGSTQLLPEGLDLLGHLVRFLEQAIAAIKSSAERLVDGHPSGRRDDSRLPKAATDRLAYPSSMLQSLLGTSKHAANRRAEAF